MESQSQRLPKSTKGKALQCRELKQRLDQPLAPPALPQALLVLHEAPPVYRAQPLHQPGGGLGRALRQGHPPDPGSGVAQTHPSGAELGRISSKHHIVFLLHSFSNPMRLLGKPAMAELTGELRFPLLSPGVFTSGIPEPRSVRFCHS